MSQASVVVRYRPVAVVLHWITAVLIAMAVPLGAVLHDLPRVPSTYAWYNVHKWIGATVFLLAVCRVGWRWLYPAPPPPPDNPAWQRHAAAVVHSLLYLLMLAVPLMGWMASHAGGHPLVWFNLVPLPAPVPVDPALNQYLHRVHSLLSWSLVVLVLLHIAAALKHQLFDRDGLLTRMWLPRSLTVGSVPTERVEEGCGIER